MSTLVTPLSVALTWLLVLSPADSPHAPGDQARLAPTAHAALPEDPSSLWLVPTESDPVSKAAEGYSALAEAVKRIEDGEFAAALQLAARPSLAKSPLAVTKTTGMSG